MLDVQQHPFRAAAVVTVAVTPRSLVRIEGAYDSGPCSWAGLTVTAYVVPEAVTIVRVPAHADHRFRRKPIADSGTSRSPIPVDADQRSFV